MSRMKKLCWIALLAAMLVTGAMSEEYRAGHAEESMTLNVVEELAEVADGISWDAGLEETVSSLVRSNVSCRYGEEKGRMGACVTAENAVICGYSADTLHLYFHDEALCMGVYTLQKECSPVTFAMLDTELQRHFGEAESWNEADFRFGGCSTLWKTALGLEDDGAEDGWWQKVTGWFGWLSDSSTAGYREWTVGERTRIALIYREANTFLGSDSLQVIFLNLHPDEHYGALEGAPLNAMLGD